MRYIFSWPVQSDSNEDLFYKVSLADDGTYGCGCPAWTKNFPRSNCKHIKKLLAALYSGERLVPQKPVGTKTDSIQNRRPLWRKRTRVEKDEQIPSVRGRVQPVQDAATGKPLPPSQASMDRLKTELQGVFEKRPEKKRRLIEF